MMFFYSIQKVSHKVKRNLLFWPKCIILQKDEKSNKLPRLYL